ncbi:MAG: hypothetical protein ACOH5I_06960 [Oligoflexus sp.]
MEDLYHAFIDRILENDTGPIGQMKPTSQAVVKFLPTTEKRELQDHNEARRLVGLPSIQVKVRHCLACGSPFESIAKRNCGCMAGRVTDVLGYDFC